MSDEARQDYVVGLVDRINHVLNGEDMANAQTALTIAVACQIVSTTEDRKELQRAAIGFARQLNEFVGRADIVEWIKANTRHVSESRRDQ